MRVNRALILLTFFTISLGKSTPGLITFSSADINHQTKEITITFTVPKKDFIYKDFITCSVDDPSITLSPWKANKPTVAHYDSSFKEAKQIFNEDFSITLILFTPIFTSFQSGSPLKGTENGVKDTSAYLYCSYYRHAEKKINHAQFPLFFAAPQADMNEMIDTDTMVIEEYEQPKKIHKTTFIEHYNSITLSLIHTIITSLHTDHKKYFALLLFLFSVLISFFYFFKKELQKQIRIKEALEIIISLFMMGITAYLLIYAYVISTPLLTMVMACICALCAGLFYIQKSTKIQSKNLRTLCTFLGILCICGTIFLLFKALQYADQQFDLL